MGGELCGLFTYRIPVAGEFKRRDVICFLESGFLIKLHIHCIMNQIVHICLINCLATNMEGQILITATGDGSPMVVIWRGKKLVFCELICYIHWKVSAEFVVLIVLENFSVHMFPKIWDYMNPSFWYAGGMQLKCGRSWEGRD